MTEIIPGRLFQRGYPTLQARPVAACMCNISDLQKHLNISVIVNLCESSNAYYARNLCNEMHVVYYPIVDYGIPKMDTFVELINTLLQEYNSGKNILVHCAGGRGRSSIVTACLYMRITSCAPDAALEHLKRTRGYGCPETQEQIDFITSYFEKIIL